jgi:hypothetical protein
MTRLISTMSVVLALFCATTTIARTWARPSDSKTYLSDGELAGIHGGTPARYCSPMTDPPPDDVECSEEVSNTKRVGSCGFAVYHSNPEQCVDDFGNDNCDSEEQSLNDVLYLTKYFCRWEFDAGQWHCTEAELRAECCVSVSTSVNCSYEQASSCSPAVKCSGTP